MALPAPFHDPNGFVDHASDVREELLGRLNILEPGLSLVVLFRDGAQVILELDDLIVLIGGAELPEGDLYVVDARLEPLVGLRDIELIQPNGALVVGACGGFVVRRHLCHIIEPVGQGLQHFVCVLDARDCRQPRSKGFQLFDTFLSFAHKINLLLEISLGEMVR